MYLRDLGALTASQLIQKLLEAIELHGDLLVFSGGSDYPSGVSSVHYNKEGNSYVSPNSFEV